MLLSLVTHNPFLSFSSFFGSLYWNFCTYIYPCLTKCFCRGFVFSLDVAMIKDIECVKPLDVSKLQALKVT